MRKMADIEKLIACGKHFCIVPWVHLFVNSFGYMNLCCLAAEGISGAGYGSLDEHSFGDLWQGEEIRKLRLRILNDEAVPQCASCYEQAKLGCWSLKQALNDLYAYKYREWVANTDSQGYAPDAKPVYWDIRFSNICNLRCRSCFYCASSGWYEESKILGLWSSQLEKASGAVTGIANPEKLLHDLEPYLPFMERIYFAGGEPLLMKENYQILKRLESIGKYDLELYFTTNLNQLSYQDYDILSIWPKFKKLIIAVSLDGLGSKCEYLRKGLHWPKALEHFTKIKRNCPDADIVINYTVSAFNVLHLSDFHREMVEQSLITAQQIHLILLENPSFCDIRILPLEMKQEATVRLQEHIQWLRRQTPFNHPEGLAKYAYFFNQWQSCIDYLNNDDWTELIPEFIRFNDSLDELRHENCLAVFPELEPLYALPKYNNHWVPMMPVTF